MKIFKFSKILKTFEDRVRVNVSAQTLSKKTTEADLKVV
jgi:hypothetical protein